MQSIFTYRFTIGLLSMLSGLLALACLVVGALAVDFNFDAFSNPMLTLRYAGNSELARWFNLLDMFGYYLLLLPLIFYFHQQYKYKSPWVSLYTFSGLAYVLIGAVGAAILAAVWPELMTDYTLAPEENKTIISTVFKATTLMVTIGMWNILEVIFAAVWWIGLGKLIYSESKGLGSLTLFTGFSALADALGTMTESPILSEAGLNLYLLLGIVWPVTMGISMVKKSVPNRQATLARTGKKVRIKMHENA